MANDIDIFIRSDSERLIKRIEELEKENAELKETFSEEVIKNLKENTSVINAVIMNKLSEKYVQLEKENADLKEQVEDWKADHEHNLELMKGLNERIAELKEELRQKSDTNHSLVEQLADKEIIISELKEQIEKMKCCGNCKYRIKKNLEGKIWVELCEKSYIKNKCEEWELAE